MAEAQPRELIVTIYGLYARERADWLPIAARHPADGRARRRRPAVRSSISRLKRRGTLRSVRVDGAAGLRAVRRDPAVLREGDRRIFDQRRASLADGWVLAVFTVPEAERDKRHELRTRLAWLGFGPVAPGVWVAPGAAGRRGRATCSPGTSWTATSICSAAQHLGYADARASGCAHWWDLDEPGRASTPRFVSRLPAVQPAAAARARVDGGAGLRRATSAMLTAWRRLPYLDPGLPPEVLPARWDGDGATQLFHELSAALRGPAHRHAMRVIRD